MASSAATAGAEKMKEKGNEFFKKGDYASAIEHYTYATEMDPNNPVFFTNRSTCYYKMDKMDKSLRDAQKSIKLDSSWAKGYYRVGLAQLALGQKKEAVEALKKAVDLQPDGAGFKADYAKAKASLMAGLSAADLLKTEGNEFFQKGDQEGAIKKYTEAYDLCTTEENELKASILANRAACYRQLYNPDAVVADCTEAIELSPNYAKAYIRRAQAYENLEKYNEALEDFQKASILAPNTPVAYQGAARIRDAIKRNQKASEGSAY